MSPPASLGQTGSVEWVAAVFALAGSREQFFLGKPLTDDLRVRPHCPNDLDCFLNVASRRFTAGMCGLAVFDDGHRLMAGGANQRRKGGSFRL
jgi:hypothetical protein